MHSMQCNAMQCNAMQCNAILTEWFSMESNLQGYLDMHIEQLIARLEKLRRSGDGKWLACCPAHQDKSPSLAIKHTNDGKILIHCFAGCDVDSIVSSIGLTLADLMPDIDNPEYKKGSKPPKFNKYELFDRLAYESIILCLAIRQLINNEPLGLDDQKRVLKAEETINDIARECRK